MHPEMPFLRLSLYLPVLLGAFALLVLGWEYELFADSGSVPNSSERLESGELALVGGFITLGLLAVSLVNRRLMLLHSRRRAVAEEEAVRDSLTGLSNRRLFLASVERALRSPLCPAEPCALLLIDLDRFKPVNDRHGHAAGDAVLIEVARRLSASFPARLDVAAWAAMNSRWCCRRAGMPSPKPSPNRSVLPARSNGRSISTAPS